MNVERAMHGPKASASPATTEDKMQGLETIPARPPPP